MQQYLTYTRYALFSALARITQEILDSHNTLVFLRSEELRTKRDSWDSYSGESVSTREKLVAIALTAQRIALVEEETRLTQLTEEKYFIKYLIDNNVSAD